MLCAQRCGQLFGRASSCAYRDSFSNCAWSPNRPQITQICADECKTEPPVCRGSSARLRLANHAACKRDAGTTLSCAAHVDAGASVDLDGFAFFDEKRNVNGFACFELCRLGDVTGGIAANA